MAVSLLVRAVLPVMHVVNLLTLVELGRVVISRSLG